MTKFAIKHKIDSTCTLVYVSEDQTELQKARSQMAELDECMLNDIEPDDDTICYFGEHNIDVYNSQIDDFELDLPENLVYIECKSY